jgi:RNA polymerase sigma factor (sigma-70 family)
VVANHADQLWEKIRAGDAEAFGLLFERHARAIYNYCFRRTADWAVAEDLTSIVFMEAWRRREKELLPEKVVPWLYGIATNVIRNRHRSVRRHAAALGRVAAPRPTADFAGDVLDRLDDEARMSSILRLVADLPRRQQDVLALCVWSELSYEEAAAALEVPVGTIRSSLSRAKARLRELAALTGHGPTTDPVTRSRTDEERTADPA